MVCVRCADQRLKLREVERAIAYTWAGGARIGARAGERRLTPLPRCALHTTGGLTGDTWPQLEL